MLAAACAQPQPPAPPVAPRASKGAAAAGLTLVAVVPPAGSAVEPRVKFRLAFDRPLDPSSVSRNNISCYYPDAQAEFVGDPFRFTSAWVDSKDPAVAWLQPPELLTGREVRLVVREGLRAQDGTGLVPLPPEMPYRVLELPP